MLSFSSHLLPHPPSLPTSRSSFSLISYSHFQLYFVPSSFFHLTILCLSPPSLFFPSPPSFMVFPSSASHFIPSSIFHLISFLLPSSLFSFSSSFSFPHFPSSPSPSFLSSSPFVLISFICFLSHPPGSPTLRLITPLILSSILSHIVLIFPVSPPLAHTSFPTP